MGLTKRRKKVRCSLCFDMVDEDHRAAGQFFIFVFFVFFFFKGFKHRSRKASKTKVKHPLELPDLRPIMQNGKELYCQEEK